MKWLANLRKTLVRGMAALSPDCRRASRLQSEALDHNLRALPHLGLRIHLLLCKWCRRYGRQIRFLHDAVRAHPDEPVEPAGRKLPEAARERIKRRLRAGEKQRRL